MRIPIDFNDIEPGDVVEHERYHHITGERTELTGYRMDEQTMKNIEYSVKTDLISEGPGKPLRKNPLSRDYWDYAHGDWYLLERKRWRHTEDAEGWAA